ncbi:MAG TPA: hypothetical protein VKB65_00830 [Myxococcota bacterium]|nr:hypothetical protein [Myxococcota bacterium]
MPRLSPEAARYLKGALAGARADGAARLQRSGAGWRMQIDRPHAGDQVFERQGQVLLVMSEEVAEALGPAVIDLHQTGRGPRLVVTGE